MMLPLSLLGVGLLWFALSFAQHFFASRRENRRHADFYRERGRVVVDGRGVRRGFRAGGR